MEVGVLETIPLFAELGSEERRQVAEACADLEVESGTLLVQEGDFGYAMFAIRAGTAEVRQGATVIRTT